MHGVRAPATPHLLLLGHRHYMQTQGPAQSRLPHLHGAKGPWPPHLLLLGYKLLVLWVIARLVGHVGIHSRLHAAGVLPAHEQILVGAAA